MTPHNGGARAEAQPSSPSELASERPARPKRAEGAPRTSRRVQREDDVADWQGVVQQETDAAFAALQRNATFDLTASVLLMVIGVVAVLLAVGYTFVRGDDMVGVLLDNERLGLTRDRILALTLPVIMLVVLATIAIVWSWAIKSRGTRDFTREMEGISRLRREAEGGVSRTRTSTHALEEYYNNSRRAFRLQLWLSRTLFIVCLVLFATAVGDAIVREVDLATVALGGGSVLSLVVAAVTGAGSRVGTHLADTTQIQLVVGGATRQVNVLEDHLYAVMAKEHDPATVAAVIDEGARRIGTIVDGSLRLIQRYAEPPNESAEQDR